MTSRESRYSGSSACSSAIVGFGLRNATATLSPGILHVITASRSAESPFSACSPLSEGGGSPCTSMIRRISARGMGPPRGWSGNFGEHRQEASRLSTAVHAIVEDGEQDGADDAQDGCNRQ